MIRAFGLDVDGGISIESLPAASSSGNDRRIDNKETNFSPSVGQTYLPADWLKFRANYSQADVMPTSTELAANFVSGGYLWIGSPGLKPETSGTYELGFDISGPNSYFSFTYFLRVLTLE